MLNSSELDSEWEWKIVGFWFNESKNKKFGSKEFFDICLKKRLNLKKIDLSYDLELQGPFHLIYHKLTPIYALEINGNKEAEEMVSRLDKYISQHPEIIMMDPIESIQTLLCRTTTYDLLSKVMQHQNHIFVPPYVKLEKNCNLDLMLKEKQITFPVVCKPLYGGGGRDAHQMALVFNKEKLKEKGILPCVAQSFIVHSAVLYKILILGEKWTVVIRPSLRDFTLKDPHETIYFDSHEISKADSSSSHTQRGETPPPKADLSILERIATFTKEALKAELFGVDVVLDTTTRKYAIIDVNAFPSYDSVPDVFGPLSEAIRKKLDGPKECLKLTQCLSSPHMGADNFFMNLQGSKSPQKDAAFVIKEETVENIMPRII